MRTTATMKARLTSLLLALVLVFSIISISAITAFAADSTPLSYVALGDSISTGYGLEGYTAASQSPNGFTYKLADAMGYELTNLAVDGNTAAGILVQLGTESVKTAVKNADVITITVGGNDLMDLLYEKIGEQTSTDKAEVPGKLQAASYAHLIAAINLLNSNTNTYLLNDPDFQTAINAYAVALKQVTGEIRSQNRNAEIVVATQYNPYVEFKGATLKLGAFTINIDPVYSGIEAGLAVLNKAINDNAEAGGYTVCDVKAAMDGYGGTEDLYNAEPPADPSSTAGINVDFHPTAAGHEIITSAFQTTLSALNITQVTVEVNCYDYMGSVSGGDSYKVGDSVTLTATPLDGMRFEYWLAAELSESPSEAALREAIVSFEPTFTFTVSESVCYMAVFSYPFDVNIRASVIGGTDSASLLNATWVDHEFAPIIPDAEAITLPGDAIDRFMVFDNIQCEFAGFIIRQYDEATDTESAILLESFTIEAEPLYGSKEWEEWYQKFSDGLEAAYIEHTHGYTTKFDTVGHWTECACTDKTSVDPHSYESDTDATCDCGYERMIAISTVIDKDVTADTYVKVDGAWKTATVAVDFRTEDELLTDDVRKIWNWAAILSPRSPLGIAFMDISVIRGGTPVHELDEPIRIQFDTEGRNILCFVTVHNGELITFEQTGGGEAAGTYQLSKDFLATLCDKFSTYAIIYEAEQTHDAPDAPQHDDNEPSDSPQTDDNKPSDSPQTGDNSHLALWIALAVVSGAVLTLTVAEKIRRNAVKGK